MDCLGITIKDVKENYKQLSRDEQVSLARRWRDNKDYDAREKLILSVLPWAIRLAQQFYVKADKKGKSTVQLDELISVSFEGVIHAVDKFDPEMGCMLTTYVSWWARQKMRLYLSNNWSDIHVPAYLLKHIKEFSELGIDDELDVTCSSEQRKVVCALRAVHSVQSLSGLYDVDGVLYLHSNVFLSTEKNPLQNVIDKEDLAFLEDCIARLNPRKQFIMRERLRGQTLKQVGEVLGITREGVRQLQVSAEKELTEYFYINE